MFLPILWVALAATVTLDVPGLTCPTCVAPVKKTLALTDGVTKVQIEWEKRTVVVEYDATKTDEAKLRAALATAGFAPLKAGDEAQALVDADLQVVEKPPAAPAALVVAGKVTVVAVGTSDCTPCDAFKRQLAVVGARVGRLAVRIVDASDPDGPGAHYLPRKADIPYAFVYALDGEQLYAGPAGDAVYIAVEDALGVERP